MRDPKRISKMLERLQKIWEAHPDYRLGQLLENVFPNRPGYPETYSRPMHHIEDEMLIETLEKFYETEKVYSYKGKEVLKEVLKKVKNA